MRADQIARLSDLTQKLAEVVLEEADPDEWPGAGVPLAALTQQERGDRYWCKRNAAATMSLLERVQRTLADAADPGANGKPNDRPELDNEIQAAEKEAARALEAARKRAAGIVKRTQNGRAA